MKQFKKEEIHGIVGTIIVHIILLLVLLLIVLDKPLPQDEEGVPVVMGNVERAKGDAFNYTEVKIAPRPAPKPVDVKPAPRRRKRMRPRNPKRAPNRLRPSAKPWRPSRNVRRPKE